MGCCIELGWCKNLQGLCGKWFKTTYPDRNGSMESLKVLLFVSSFAFACNHKLVAKSLLKVFRNIISLKRDTGLVTKCLCPH